jgi:hypothetical protein
VKVFGSGTNALAQGLHHRNQSRMLEMVNGKTFNFREEGPAIPRLVAPRKNLNDGATHVSV